MKYILHDTNAIDDEKMTELFLEYGYEGIGLFWCVLEKIGKQEKPIKTKVLKSQLKVGKKLDKCWNFMESIGILSSNNGETFNERILSYSETYKIKKEKNKEKISQWRENQTVEKNVTGYEPSCNPPKVKESKVKESKVNNPVVDAIAPTGKLEILPTVFWKELTDVWFKFYKKYYLTDPSFIAAEGKQLKSILTRLEKKTKEKGFEWTEKHSADCLAQFLERARSDEWLSRNFSLANLDSKFDIIITQKNGQASNAKQQTGKVTGEQLNQAFTNFYTQQQ
jgi:hypothetical protein